MKVIAGKLRGRSIIAPPGLETRPIPDRVKKALFDILGSRLALPGSLPAVAVLDMFAGSGALGIEALSRGAAFCCFVESDPRAVRALKANIESLNLSDQAEILQADALSTAVPSGPQEGFGIVFLDPPYRLSRLPPPTGPIPALLEQLPQRARLSNDAIIVLRHEAAVSYALRSYGRLEPVMHRTYGKMAITLLALR